MNPVTLGRLVSEDGDRVIPLMRDKIVIGRKSHCDVCLDSTNVSSEHCELSHHHGCWHVRDLGSKNGIKVNGDRVQQATLRPGDGLRIGNMSFTIQYQLSEEVAAELDADQEEEDSLNKPLLKRIGLFGRRPDGEQPPAQRPPILEDEDVDEDDDDDDF